MKVFEAISNQGIICDGMTARLTLERKPDVIRIAPAPLYNTFVDVFKCVKAIDLALKSLS
jgi:kynureninase